jgi:hypothetical protein
VEIFYASVYQRSVRGVFTAAEQAAAEQEIAADPTAWPVIPRSGGLRKARAARGGKGKSGGARVIYFHVAEDGAIYFLFAYAKNVQEDLRPDQLKRLRDLAATLKE